MPGLALSHVSGPATDGEVGEELSRNWQSYYYIDFPLKVVDDQLDISILTFILVLSIFAHLRTT